MTAAVFLLGFSSLVLTASTSVLDPLTLNDDHGNSANENSTISYRAISDTKGTAMKCSGCVGSGGIKPFLKTAKGFSKLVMPDFPYKLVEEISDHDFDDITDDYQQLIKDYIGLLICVGVGFLFIIIFPIVGCCFCCCRCCGKCGGSRRTDGEPKSVFARRCFIIAQLVLAAFVGAGGVIILVTSSSIKDGLNSVHDDVPDNIDALKKFLNDSNTAINELATVDLNFTRRVIFRDLDNIGHIFGGNVRQNFLDETKSNIDDIKTSVESMDTALATLKSQIPEVNRQLNYTTSNVTAYKDAMKKVKSDFEKQTNDHASDIFNTIDSSKLEPIQGVSKITNVGNLTQHLQDSLKDIDDIPRKVHDESQTAVSDSKSSIKKYISDVDETTSKFDIANRAQLGEFNDKVRDYSDKAIKYDKYRDYGFKGIGGIILLITVLYLLGLAFGVCGSNGDTLPQERGCVSNSGGNFLIAAVTFTFLFGSLLMFFTTLLFVIGAPIEKYGCGVIEDTSIIDKLMNKYNVLRSKHGTGNILADKILDDPNKIMSLTKIITSCQNDDTLYSALRINESLYFNITKILDYKSEFSVEDKMASIKVNFDNIKVMKGSLEKNLKDLNDSIQYNFTKYDSQLNQNATYEAMRFKHDLEKRLPSLKPAKKIHYKTTINDLQKILNKEGKDLQASMTQLKSLIEDLSHTLTPNVGPSISDKIEKMRAAMMELDGKVQQAGNTSFEKGREFFIDRIFGIADAYVDRLLHALNHDIGRCRPVWDAYNSIFIENMCDTLIASLNGFWFAIGWSLFFLMPSIVIAVKLANHFRTMTLYEEPLESPPTPGIMIEMNERFHGNGHIFAIHNKVGPNEPTGDVMM